MGRVCRTDMRGAITKYFDSAGNEVDVKGEIKDWREMEKTIARLKDIIERAHQADSIELARNILEEA